MTRVDAATHRRRARNASLSVGMALLLVAGLTLPLLAISPAHAVDEIPPETNAEEELAAPPTSEDPADELLLEGTVRLRLGSEFTVVPGGRSTVTFAVPSGFTAVALEAEMVGAQDAPLEVSQNGRMLATVTAEQERILVPLDAATISDDGTLPLTFALASASGTWCALDGVTTNASSSVTVQEAALLLGGTADVPTSVAGFFANGVTTVTVEIPGDAQPDLTAAALNLVTAVTHALGQESTVKLQTDAGAPADIGAEEGEEVPLFARRIVRLLPGSGPAVTSIDQSDDGVARLTISGDPAELIEAARAFALDGIALASAADTEGLAGRLEPTAKSGTLTLQQLGTGRVVLEGYGVQDAFIGIPQGAFGRTLERVDLELHGTASTTNAAIATVQLLWNDRLVDSFVLDPSDPQIERSITLSEVSLRSGNGLVVRMQAVTANNDCIDESLLPQVRLDLDTGTSTATGVGGAPAVLGFSDFPQSFGGRIDLAFGSAPTSAQLGATADLLAALQRATPEPMIVELIDANELIDGSGAGVLVGATPEQAHTLRTPLRLADVRLISDGAGELTVEVDQPYGALQAVRQNGRALLVLGAFLGDDAADPDGVLAAAVGGLDGTAWWSLNGSIRLATPATDAVIIDTNAIVPQDEAKADFVPVAWWAIAGVIVLIAAGIVAALIRARRQRAVRATVEAEVALAAMDAEAAGEQPDPAAPSPASPAATSPAATSPDPASERFGADPAGGGQLRDESEPR